MTGLYGNFDKNNQHSQERSHNSQPSSHAPEMSVGQEQATFTSSSHPASSATHKPCNCRKSKCLKLYCECFANNRYCGAACACVCCHNVSGFDAIRIQAKQHILMRNPQAFRQTKIVQQSATEPHDLAMSDAMSAYSSIDMSGATSHLHAGAKDAKNAGEKRHFKGCNCRKSHCQKKYCECYQAGVPCSDLCNCDQCENTEAHMAAHAKMIEAIRSSS